MNEYYVLFARIKVEMSDSALLWQIQICYDQQPSSCYQIVFNVFLSAGRVNRKLFLSSKEFVLKQPEF